MATSGALFFVQGQGPWYYLQSVSRSCLLNFMPLCHLGNLLDWATFRRQKWSYPGSRSPMTQCQTDTSCQSPTNSDTARSHPRSPDPWLVITSDVLPYENKESLVDWVTAERNSNAWPLKCDSIVATGSKRPHFYFNGEGQTRCRNRRVFR